MKDILLKVLTFVNDNWEIIAPVIYEILARIIPTKGNISIVDNVVKIIRFILPNKRKPLPTDIPVPIDPKFNRVIVDRSKHIISCFAFLVLTVPAFGQLSGTFKTLRFVPAQDTTVLNATPTQYPVGTVTRLSNDSLYYKFPDGFWHPLTGGGGGGGGLLTADNGLAVSGGTNVQLGGTLTKTTTINGAASFAFNAINAAGMTLSTAVGNIAVNPTGNFTSTTVGAGSDINFTAVDDFTLVTGDNLNLTATGAGTPDINLSAGAAIDLNAGTDLSIGASDEVFIDAVTLMTITAQNSGVDITTTGGGANVDIAAGGQFNAGGVASTNLTAGPAAAINLTTNTGGDIVINSDAQSRLIGDSGGSAQSEVNASSLGVIITASGAADVSLTGDDVTFSAVDDTTFSNGAGGFIIMANLPANCTGAPTGALSNQGGVMTICP